jgi:hypothetical protein
MNNLKMSQNLPMLEPLDPQRPQSGYMRRAMTNQDFTDSGIVERIMYAAKQGAISPEVVKYLLENMQESYDQSNEAISGLPGAPNMPNPNNVVMPGLLSR